jgi:plasmid maintenance system antidote protein VapI
MPTFMDYDFVSPLPHPGEVLRKDFMAPLGMSAGALAKAMGPQGPDVY